jgi:predicted GNAT family N-acyltransferase
MQNPSAPAAPTAIGENRRAMRLVELDPEAEPYWEEMLAGEQAPWGGVGERLCWRSKTRNIGLRDEDGTLLAAGGVVLAEVHTADHPPFAVAGLGGLVVRSSARGQGLVRRLAPHLLEIARELPTERAMLFCRPGLMALYGEFGFREIGDAVWVHQPGGQVKMPLSAMWSPLREGIGWPAGELYLDGEPF